mmetsp:Transcript_42874/g.110555  ORF Transcript_42874/g.110555 Transcript_42874/m.110555 type:complete len:1070 (-) Transcript_42874:406-3615(-)
MHQNRFQLSGDVQHILKKVQDEDAPGRRLVSNVSFGAPFVVHVKPPKTSYIHRESRGKIRELWKDAIQKMGGEHIIRWLKDQEQRWVQRIDDDLVAAYRFLLENKEFGEARKLFESSYLFVQQNREEDVGNHGTEKHIWYTVDLAKFKEKRDQQDTENMLKLQLSQFHASPYMKPQPPVEMFAKGERGLLLPLEYGEMEFGRPAISAQPHIGEGHFKEEERGYPVALSVSEGKGCFREHIPHIQRKSAEAEQRKTFSVPSLRLAAKRRRKGTQSTRATHHPRDIDQGTSRIEEEEGERNDDDNGEEEEGEDNPKRNRREVAVEQEEVDWERGTGTNSEEGTSPGEHLRALDEMDRGQITLISEGMAMLSHGRSCHIQASTGFGKTISILIMVWITGLRCVWVTSLADLVHQTREEMRQLLPGIKVCVRQGSLPNPFVFRKIMEASAPDSAAYRKAEKGYAKALRERKKIMEDMEAADIILTTYKSMYEGKTFGVLSPLSFGDQSSSARTGPGKKASHSQKASRGSSDPPPQLNSEQQGQSDQSLAEAFRLLSEFPLMVFDESHNVYADQLRRCLSFSRKMTIFTSATIESSEKCLLGFLFAAPPLLRISRQSGSPIAVQWINVLPLTYPGDPRDRDEFLRVDRSLATETEYRDPLCLLYAKVPGNGTLENFEITNRACFHPFLLFAFSFSAPILHTKQTGQLALVFCRRILEREFVSGMFEIYRNTKVRRNSLSSVSEQERLCETREGWEDWEITNYVSGAVREGKIRKDWKETTRVVIAVDRCMREGFDAPRAKSLSLYPEGNIPQMVGRLTRKPSKEVRFVAINGSLGMGKSSLKKKKTLDIIREDFGEEVKTEERSAWSFIEEVSRLEQWKIHEEEHRPRWQIMIRLGNMFYKILRGIHALCQERYETIQFCEGNAAGRPIPPPILEQMQHKNDTAHNDIMGQADPHTTALPAFLEGETHLVNYTRPLSVEETYLGLLDEMSEKEKVSKMALDYRRYHDKVPEFQLRSKNRIARVVFHAGKIWASIFSNMAIDEKLDWSVQTPSSLLNMAARMEKREFASKQQLSQ